MCASDTGHIGQCACEKLHCHIYTQQGSAQTLISEGQFHLYKKDKCMVIVDDITYMKNSQWYSRLCFLLAHRETASFTGKELRGGPSIAMRSNESNVCSYILFLIRVLISFSWENVRSTSAVCMDITLHILASVLILGKIV